MNDYALIRSASVGLVTAALASGCAYGGAEFDREAVELDPALAAPTLAPKQFFENSVRRDATTDEAQQVVNVDGCAAFFLENTQGKTYLASARHCFNYSITNWCPTGTLRDNQGNTGRCLRVVAGDVNHDIAVFEGEMPYVPARQHTLRLAAYSPAVGTKLQMIGYPADQDPTTARRGRLTVTESCWILASDVSSPHSNILDRSALHNCSTYGGNSGGPMIAEGKRVAVGLPFTYMPGDYTRRSSTDLSTAAHMAKMADAATTFRAQLDAAGIVVLDAEPVADPIPAP